MHGARLDHRPISGPVSWLLSAAAVAFVCPASFAADSDCAESGPARQTAAAQIVDRSSNPAQRFRSARLLAQNGQYRAAICEYEQLSAAYPDNVDYLFGEAQARYWSGDRDGALKLLPRARQLAPGYEDVWRLEYQVLKSLSGPENRQRAGALRAEALQRFPDASWLQGPGSPETSSLRWEFGMNIDSLDNGAADWQHVYAHIDRRTADDSAVYLTLAEHRRFSLTDRDLAAGGSFKPSENWIVDGGVHLSPNARFLPEGVADLGVSRILGDGWIAGVNVGQRRYADDTVNSFGLEIERYFGRFRAAWQLRNIRLGSASSFVQGAVLNYYAESGTRYGLTAAVGDEVEIVAPGRLLEMDISVFALTGSHPLGERLSILWRVGTHDQGSLYRRNSVGLSLAGEF